MINFRKITPFNGFYENSNLGQQNNYAWSMAEFEDYIYVGTGRNIVFAVLSVFFNLSPDSIPVEFIPKPSVDMNGEIWRYKKDGSENWTRVYKASPEESVVGFRYMYVYTTPSGKKALYAFTNSPNVKVFMSENGLDWKPADKGIDTGDTTRAVIEHNNKLYLGLMKGLGGSLETILYETTNPEEGWQRVIISNVPGNPQGEIASMESFNGHLYIGTAPPGGFEVWRTKDLSPSSGWKLVVDKGAGEALNELPLCMKAYKGNIYVGTGIWFGIYSINPNKELVPPKGFDLLVIDPCDRWKVIVGNEPIAPTEPITRGLRDPIYPAGLGFLSNAYCWQLIEFKDKLYLSTWDWSVLVPTLLKSLGKDLNEIKAQLFSSDSENNIDINMEYNYLPLIESIVRFLITFRKTMGGDIWVSSNGSKWTPITLNGLNDPHNYGIRELLSTEEGNLYAGTANPYDGCEVWVSEHSINQDYKEFIELLLDILTETLKDC